MQARIYYCGTMPPLTATRYLLPHGHRLQNSLPNLVRGEHPWQTMTWSGWKSLFWDDPGKKKQERRLWGNFSQALSVILSSSGSTPSSLLSFEHTSSSCGLYLLVYAHHWRSSKLIDYDHTGKCLHALVLAATLGEPWQKKVRQLAQTSHGMLHSCLYKMMALSWQLG